MTLDELLPIALPVQWTSLWRKTILGHDVAMFQRSDGLNFSVSCARNHQGEFLQISISSESHVPEASDMLQALTELFPDLASKTLSRNLLVFPAQFAFSKNLLNGQLPLTTSTN